MPTTPALPAHNADKEQSPPRSGGLREGAPRAPRAAGGWREAAHSPQQLPAGGRLTPAAAEPPARPRGGGGGGGSQASGCSRERRADLGLRGGAGTVPDPRPGLPGEPRGRGGVGGEKRGLPGTRSPGGHASGWRGEDPPGVPLPPSLPPGGPVRGRGLSPLPPPQPPQRSPPAPAPSSPSGKPLCGKAPARGCGCGGEECALPVVVVWGGCDLKKKKKLKNPGSKGWGIPDTPRTAPRRGCNLRRPLR